MTTNNNKNGWNEWSNKVLGDLKDLKETYKEILRDIKNLEIEMAIIKTKAAIYGALGGAITTIIFGAILTYIVKSLIKS